MATTSAEFVEWAAGIGIKRATAEALALRAPRNVQAMIEAQFVNGARYYFYTLDDIRHEHKTNKFKSRANGLLLFAFCGNGDPIAIDLRGEESIWYISHDDMHKRPLRSVAIRVADDLQDMLRREMPRCYFEAEQSHNPPTA